MQADKQPRTGAAVRVLRALKGMGRATKQQLAQATGLSVMAVGTAVDQLLAKGRILCQGRAAGTGGRPAAEYGYHAGYAHALILCAWEQHGRDSLHLRTVDLMGNCVHSATHPLEHVQLGAFVPEIEAVLEQDKSVAALGFGLPGTQRLGRLVTSDYAGLLGTEFAAYYRQRFSMPVVLENDVNAAALGYCSLRGKPDATVCYLYFPRHYGPGAGLVLAGRRFCGARGLAGEIGRLLPGTDWQAFSWEAFLPACRVVAACAGAAAAFLDPEEIVLCGEALGPAHLEQVRRQCAKMLAGPPPRFTLAENFLEDYTAGVASQTLEALECALETEL